MSDSIEDTDQWNACGEHHRDSHHCPSAYEQEAAEQERAVDRWPHQMGVMQVVQSGGVREAPKKKPREGAGDRDERCYQPILALAVARTDCRCGQIRLPLEAEMTLNRVVAAKIDIEAKAGFFCAVSRRLADVGRGARYR
jgi:hypothetical protein